MRAAKVSQKTKESCLQILNKTLVDYAFVITQSGGGEKLEEVFKKERLHFFGQNVSKIISDHYLDIMCDRV